MLLRPECRYPTALEGVPGNVVKIEIDIVHNSLSNLFLCK